MSEASLSPKRPRLDYDDSSGKEDHYDKYKNREREHDEQNSYSQPKHRKRSDPEDDDGKEEDGKTKTVNIDTARREHTLVMRLTNKEQELQDCMNQIQEMKQAQTQNTAQLRSMLLDPAINLVFQRMAKEMDEHKEKLKQKQNELSAGKFTRDSQIGRRMMTRCRLLLQENTELGKMISSGRTARLEGEIVLHKALVTEMKKNQKELDEFVGELEEDVEGMQGMIFMLQQQLKEAREQIARLQQENEQLRTLRMPPDPEPGGIFEDSNSNSNTPTHNWSADTGSKSESGTATPKLLSSSVNPGLDINNGILSDDTDKRTSPVIPPALSALSGKNRTSEIGLDVPSTAQSTDDDCNFHNSKLTPDSCKQTQHEETATPMDTSDPATFSNQQQRQQLCDSDGNPAEHVGNAPLIKNEIAVPEPGLQRTTSPSCTIASINSNSTNDFSDGNLKTTSLQTSVTMKSSELSSNGVQNCNENPIAERTTESPNTPAAISNATDGCLTNESKEDRDGHAERTNSSNLSAHERTSTILSAENDMGKKTGEDDVKDENKTPLHSTLGLNVNVRLEDDKSDCQTRISLVNGSSSLPGQGL